MWLARLGVIPVHMCNTRTQSELHMGYLKPLGLNKVANVVGILMTEW